MNLADILSFIESLKRKGSDAFQNPLDYAGQVAGQINDSGKSYGAALDAAMPDNAPFRGPSDARSAAVDKVLDALTMAPAGIAKMATRMGQIAPSGGYFSGRGPSTYFQPGEAGVGTFNIGKVNLLDTSNPQQALPVLKDLGRHPRTREAETAIRQQLAEAIRDARAGRAPMVNYMLADDTPIKEVASQHGYGGVKVFENDDWTSPTSMLIWDLLNLRPHGQAAKDLMPK